MIEASQHQAIRNGEPIEAFSQHDLRVGHFCRRSAGQSVSKAVSRAQGQRVVQSGPGIARTYLTTAE